MSSNGIGQRCNSSTTLQNERRITSIRRTPVRPGSFESIIAQHVMGSRGAHSVGWLPVEDMKLTITCRAATEKDRWGPKGVVEVSRQGPDIGMRDPQIAWGKSPKPSGVIQFPGPAR